ncbi:hypothetical protein DEJ50_01755 [Streptomyces venezuelae]|uniref:Uncharacterized protein n=1 Tax=Streptomyces venezuelae TaxID=54571 RepID=A0A5P2CXQ8_STRVZ|nr:hypothetical protein [Streptomyces venezuelae]QES46767.1 hypothetical protein DEJ50_01755 [Streptomyces venezuelae]
MSYAVLDGAYWAGPHDEDCPRCARVRSAGTSTRTDAGAGDLDDGDAPPDTGRPTTAVTATATGTAARWVDSLQDALVDTDHPRLRTALLIGSVTTVLAGAAATRWS